ncbi:metallophosphoesterase family protein [Streptomyces albiaxialis]|uniref:Metallophosphoesterase family protein n=1 Tax=Streptomyces albiaxialis TaxID=329523 RepID=A0ABN2W8I7_9ACTN
MPHRVAVLSDVHGVVPALEAVLAEPDVRGADLVVLTGDLAAGPQPAETLDLLAGLGDRALWISGNADRELVEYRRGTRDTIPDPIGPWAAGALREDQVELLGSLPGTATLDVSGMGPVLFCHATPRDDAEPVVVDSPLARWREVFAGLADEVRTVVCGNTHMPFVRLVDGRLVVNPGSVGMPYGRDGAHWALLGPGAELRRTGYDVDAAVARVVADSGYEDVASWTDYFLRARATDEEALRAFSG